LSEDGALPLGVTFHDNGDGTGTLSGAPAASTVGIYAIVFHADPSPDHFLSVIFSAPWFSSYARIG